MCVELMCAVCCRKAAQDARAALTLRPTCKTHQAEGYEGDDWDRALVPTLPVPATNQAVHPPPPPTAHAPALVAPGPAPSTTPANLSTPTSTQTLPDPAAMSPRTFNDAVLKALESMPEAAIAELLDSIPPDTESTSATSSTGLAVSSSQPAAIFVAPVVTSQATLPLTAASSSRPLARAIGPLWSQQARHAREARDDTQSAKAARRSHAEEKRKTINLVIWYDVSD